MNPHRASLFRKYLFDVDVNNIFRRKINVDADVCYLFRFCFQSNQKKRRWRRKQTKKMTHLLVDCFSPFVFVSYQANYQMLPKWKCLFWIVGMKIFKIFSHKIIIKFSICDVANINIQTILCLSESVFKGRFTCFLQYLHVICFVPF